MSPRIYASGLALLFTVSAAQAQEFGWGSGYQMGTSYTGVFDGHKARLTFYCGDAGAARANPAITAGPYLTVVLPKVTGLESATTIEVVVDGKTTKVPVAARPDIETVDLTWRPGQVFGGAEMKRLVAALRMAKAIQVKAAGVTASLPVEGAAKALAGDPLSCS